MFFLDGKQENEKQSLSWSQMFFSPSIYPTSFQTLSLWNDVNLLPSLLPQDENPNFYECKYMLFAETTLLICFGGSFFEEKFIDLTMAGLLGAPG